ncbi:hypothetical protein L195_g059098 [Trifolium pratense]|uniref:Uncharacterized protein n=1 Tax=Trifolium pratense TaxID=57577 RepID=A0A2K3JW25_TRIPR|nr:hypothetical protein L195_g059098 [Trifolium pratense]
MRLTKVSRRSTSSMNQTGILIGINSFIVGLPSTVVRQEDMFRVHPVVIKAPLGALAARLLDIGKY